ncbi:envelope glycoprotein RL10 [Panine betaherpesvirus 2]|uniref:Envelope glycoprotein RL10 n=1 Tax=Panine betaherpesvirus 2 TaxID=188763 RepID=Q8QS87_9BETA|nr:envelope glycoprotein RL10 [Panine betaherpesvirus 2]AAM00650.1 envelope glycoprotein RL10 [Panine betaherpesvirus 2]QXV67752.1 envelope glycoprotein RL10 [Panine betaherpesvirus 2]
MRYVTLCSTLLLLAIGATAIHNDVCTSLDGQTRLLCKCNRWNNNSNPKPTATSGTHITCLANCTCKRYTEPLPLISVLGIYSAWGAGSFIATLIILLVIFFVIYSRERPADDDNGTVEDPFLAYRDLTRKKLDSHASKKQNIYERIPYRPCRQLRDDEPPLITNAEDDDEEEDNF